jgi:NAD(P)-dependent dehydrogenase (short-subunit alcohol dehydrogenase family)
MTAERVALVTAGANGIGRAIAETLAAQGVAVFICDIDKQALESCLADNPEMRGSVVDVAVPTEVDQLFVELAKYYDRLDILVNNAGIAGPTALVEDIRRDDWERTIAVDLNSVFYVTQLATPLLKASAGSVVNIASNAAMFGFPMRSPYTAAKWALIGLTKTWAMEMGPYGVNVNALCPGSVSGARIDGVIERDALERGVKPADIRKIYQRQSSMRVFVSPQEVAAMAAFLCSPAGHNISGQSLAIDGHTEGLSNWLDE